MNWQRVKVGIPGKSCKDLIQGSGGGSEREGKREELVKWEGWEMASRLKTWETGEMEGRGQLALWLKSLRKQA